MVGQKVDHLAGRKAVLKVERMAVMRARNSAVQLVEKWAALKAAWKVATKAAL